MAGKRPINAERSGGDQQPTEQRRAPPAKSRPRSPSASRAEADTGAPDAGERKPIPAALKAIGGLVVVAVVFLVAAVLGGGGSNKQDEKPAPAPVRPRPNRRPRKSRPPLPRRPKNWATRPSPPTTRPGSAAPTPATTAAGVALAVFPSTNGRAAARRGHPGRRRRLAGRGRRRGPDGGAGAGAAARLRRRRASRPDLPGPRRPRPAGKQRHRQGAGLRDRRAPRRRTGCETTRGQGGEPGRPRRRDRGAARTSCSATPPQHIVLAPEDEPDFAMPAAAWAARSGDPVLFSGADKLPARRPPAR